MRKLHIGAVAVLCIAWLGLSGCSQPAAEAVIKKKYPNAEVRNVPNESYRWLIRLPDGSVRYAFHCNGGDFLTDEVELFPAIKP